jgi:hypothetical protein
MWNGSTSHISLKKKNLVEKPQPNLPGLNFIQLSLVLTCYLSPGLNFILLCHLHTNMLVVQEKCTNCSYDHCDSDHEFCISAHCSEDENRNGNGKVPLVSAKLEW